MPATELKTPLTGLNNASTILVPTSGTGNWIRLGGAEGGSGGHTIQEEGVDLTQRTNLNFIGQAGALQISSGNDATDVTILPHFRVSADDTTPSELESKTSAGTNIRLNTLNPAANEQLEISSDPKILTINVEQLSGTKTLTATDPVYHVLDSNGAARDVVIHDPPVAGRRFIIEASNTDGLNIKETAAGATLVTLLTGVGNPFKIDCISDGTDLYISVFDEA